MAARFLFSCFMESRIDGYVTELPYTSNHFPEMAPENLRLALLHVGLDSPALHEGFTYLELGFGQGLGLNLYAATHPQGRFFGNDFMPAHLQSAQQLADSAGLDNLSLFQDSFAELLQRDLPAMDYIVLHGVYSWVNDENRAVVIDILRKLLKPSGVVYVSYNCLPGWSLKAPMQRLMREFAERQTRGSALQRFHAARDFLLALDGADAAFFASNPAARAMLSGIAQAGDAYLLHEFAHEGWAPFYHADVASALAAAELSFAGSARLFNNFPAWSVPPKSRALFYATHDVGMRELLRDFAMQTQLRRDIFVRQARPLAADEARERFLAQRIALCRPPASAALTSQTPLGEVRLEAYHAPIIEALASGPQTVQALLRLAPLAGHDMPVRFEAINMLLCLGYVLPVPAEPLGEPAAGRVRALNRTLLGRVLAGERVSGFASPLLATPVAIAYHDQLFLAAQRQAEQGAEALASFALRVAAPGQEPEARLAAMTQEAANFLRYGQAFYDSLQLF